MKIKKFDIAIIGGGIIGTAVALSILNKKKLSIIIIEAEEKLAQHQTGNNSGVIHSGLYYKPGSLKAINCSTGRELMYNYCEANNIKFEKCGKLVVANNEIEIPALNELERRGKSNGLQKIKRLNKDELKDYEPFVKGIHGLFVEETGIVDYKDVVNSYSNFIKERNGEIKTNCKFLSLLTFNNEFILQTTQGEIKTNYIINCAGLQSDRVAKMCGVFPSVQIIPFRGEYYKLKKEKEHLVKNLIYPVPDPRFPFLGVHFTRMIKGGIEAGPNAVLAFKREGYSHKDFSFKDSLDMLKFSGFWKMAFKYYKIGYSEFMRSLSKKLFVRSLQKLVPAIEENDIESAGSGVRAQAVDRNGKLVDDFSIIETEKMVHVLNAPSPAATSSISIGNTIAERILIKL